MITSADDLIGATEMTADETSYVYERLILSSNPNPHHQSIHQFASHNNLMPMLVARTVAENRQSDTTLNSLIATNEFLIRSFGKKRTSREFVEAAMAKTSSFWRNGDPLGVYQPGDMFYVDENHPLRQWFPWLILAPTAFLAFLTFAAFLVHAVLRL